MNPIKHGRIVGLASALALTFSAPALAQVDFSRLRDYLDLLINDTARLGAASFNADRISVVQECSRGTWPKLRKTREEFHI
jgi:hypothetical protein